MRGLKAAGITLDRKMLADMAVTQSAAFADGGGAGQGRAPGPGDRLIRHKAQAQVHKAPPSLCVEP